TFGGTGFGLARAVGHSSPAEIDEFGLVTALRMAGMRALARIAAGGGHVGAILLDGKHDWLTAPAPTMFEDPAAASAVLPHVTTVIKGDNLCASIAAGSVIAKVERDRLMAAAHEEHPHYGWGSNMGYGARAHLDAIRAHGPSVLHRRSWKLPTP